MRSLLVVLFIFASLSMVSAKGLVWQGNIMLGAGINYTPYSTFYEEIIDMGMTNTYRETNEARLIIRPGYALSFSLRGRSEKSLKYDLSVSYIPNYLLLDNTLFYSLQGAVKTRWSRLSEHRFTDFGIGVFTINRTVDNQSIFEFEPHLSFQQSGLFGLPLMYRVQVNVSAEPISIIMNGIQSFSQERKHTMSLYFFLGYSFGSINRL